MKELCSEIERIAYIMATDGSEKSCEDYVETFAELVDNSNLNADNKTYVKAVGSIAIRSNHYWYAEE